MASSSGDSSGSPSLLTNSSLEDDVLAVMDQKKRKRKLLNKESARRSRMRKTKHEEDLKAEIIQLKETNIMIQTSVSFITQNQLVLEAENSVLRTQVIELNSWLNSINEILQIMTLNNSCSVNPQMMASECFINNPWSFLLMNQPTMALPNMLQHYY